MEINPVSRTLGLAGFYFLLKIKILLFWRVGDTSDSAQVTPFSALRNYTWWAWRPYRMLEIKLRSVQVTTISLAPKGVQIAFKTFKQCRLRFLLLKILHMLGPARWH